jgi:enoyl-CoA hydratase
VLLAEPFPPDDAVGAGFLDRLADPARLTATAREIATAALGLDPDAHAATKLRAREPALRAIRADIDADRAAARQ